MLTQAHPSGTPGWLDVLFAHDSLGHSSWRVSVHNHAAFTAGAIPDLWAVAGGLCFSSAHVGQPTASHVLEEHTRGSATLGNGQFTGFALPSLPTVD